MAISVKITPRNVGPWIVHALKEGERMLAAKLRGGPGREEGVPRYVEEHARRGDPESVLAAMDTYARSERFLMNVGVAKGAILEEALRDSGAGRVLELGGYCGYSAVRTARLLDREGSQLISIEKSPEFAKIAERIVEFAGLSDKVEIRVGDSGDVIPKLRGPFDLIFIDHLKDRYLPDLLLVEKHGLMHEGSIVVADHVGIFETSLRKYLEHVRDPAHYQTRHHKAHMEYEDHIEDGVEVSVWRHATNQ